MHRNACTVLAAILAAAAPSFGQEASEALSFVARDAK